MMLSITQAIVTVVLSALSALALADLPGDSIYQLDSQWTDQNNRELNITDFAGKKVVLSMTYTSCQHTCPTIVSNMQAIEKALDKTQRDQVAFVLVSLLPVTDTPAAMKAYEKKRGLEGWSLLSGSDADVRSLAMALNIRYKPTGIGEVSHSNLINIIGPEGSLQFAVSGVSDEPVEAINYLKSNTVSR
jgi:protein SCO1/2